MKRFLAVGLLVLGCIFILLLVVIGVIIVPRVASHHFAYYHVSKDFLCKNCNYARPEKEEKQFLSFTPFPFSLNKPKLFLKDSIVAFDQKWDDDVKVAKIISASSDGNEYVVEVDGDSSKQPIKIQRDWIIGLD